MVSGHTVAFQKALSGVYFRLGDLQLSHCLTIAERMLENYDVKTFN